MHNNKPMYVHVCMYAVCYSNEAKCVYDGVEIGHTNHHCAL